MRFMLRSLLFCCAILFTCGPVYCQTTDPQLPETTIVDAPQEAEATSTEVTSEESEHPWLLQIWRFEILNFEGRPLTVSKVVTGLFILIFSIQLARIFSRKLHDLFNRMGMNPSTAGATKNLLFYGLLIISAMITLEIIEIPLTIFTLLGGAVAIGIGFGSQNLMNNFISGLILLVERPIQVGNLIQIGDLHGTVTSIGGRSTMVRTGTNVDIIIPNSSFLEQNVVNWTLVDDRIRTCVKVGVAYGSPVTLVSQLLSKAASAEPAVLKDPEPIVLFSDFGDSALLFEVHFWTKMRSIMDRWRTESRLRFIITDLFEKEGIVIAFPQCDIHLNTVKPVEITMVDQVPSQSSSVRPLE